MKHPVGKEAKMNRAEEREPHSGHEAPARAAGVGDEKKADMRGAIDGSPTDKNPLRGAMRELHEQHPHAYHEHGPHHGTKDHIRHEPMHGLLRRGED